MDATRNLKPWRRVLPSLRSCANVKRRYQIYEESSNICKSLNREAGRGKDRILDREIEEALRISIVVIDPHENMSL